MPITPAILKANPFRIYRAAPKQLHDLSIVLDTQDIYAEDKWGRLYPGEEMIFDPAGMGVQGEVAELWAERGVDLERGYFLNMKKPRVVDGEREAVTTALSAIAAENATELAVYETTGFENGDQVCIKEGATVQICKIKTVYPFKLVLYDEDGLNSAFAKDSTVYVSYFYRVMSRKTTHSTPSPYQGVIIQEIMGRAGMV